MQNSRDDAALLRLLQLAAIASNEASDLKSAAAICLLETRRATGWPVGHLYLSNEDGTAMEPTGVWSLADPVAYNPFRETTDQLTLPAGKGLAGRVLATSTPHWIVDARIDDNFPCAAVAASVGLGAGLAFPILAGDHVAGVMELFASEVAPPNKRLLDILSQVGRQLGRVVERERAAESLRAGEARFRAITRSATDAIVVADVNGTVTFWNEAAGHMFGYTEQDILGRPLTMLMPESFREAHSEGIRRMGRGGESRVIGKVVELVGLHKDGHQFPIELSLSTWEGQGQRSYSGIIRDITARKAAEAAAREQDLRLREAAKMESIGLLAGGIAHDFNNVLSAIYGCAELMAEDLSKSDPLYENVVIIRESAERAAGMTRHLLAFSRRQILIVEAIDLNELVGKFHKMLARLVPETIRVEVSLGKNVPTINADYTQIEQVVLNLVVNARDAMPGGGRLLITTSEASMEDEVAQRHGLARGRCAVVSISDTGIGMDAETQARIFEPFFTTKGHEGTGLGLATVYGIVHQTGGNIWVTSERGKGSTFKVYFPAALEGAEVPSTMPTARMQRGAESLLLIEDDPAVRKVTAGVLRRQGYSVEEAASAEEALRIDPSIVKKTTLVISDVMLPGKNGRELAEMLWVNHPGLRVLFVSGWENGIVDDTVLREGVAFLPKPFTARDLLKHVRALLDVQIDVPI